MSHHHLISWAFEYGLQDIVSDEEDEVSSLFNVASHWQLVVNNTTLNKLQVNHENQIEEHVNEPPQQVSQSSECCVCMINPCNTALIPCGHKDFCQDCATIILHHESENMPPPPKWPKCRMVVTQILKLIWWFRLFTDNKTLSQFVLNCCKYFLPIACTKYW